MAEKKTQKRETPAPERKIAWFAKGGGIKKTGPFKDQIEAAAAMELTDNRGKPSDFATWPEYV